MAESLFPTFEKISQTPMRDILRLRVTGRLAWKSQLAATNLPEEAKGLISRVVHRTRLFRLEKVAVASELTSHFMDGLEAGTAVAELVERFGDERVAALLIRRAKRRGRPVLWHIWNFCFRIAAIFIAIYVGMLIRFCVGHPTPCVDYVAQLNKPDLTIAPGDKGWRIWREAILTTSDGTVDGYLTFPKEIGGGHDRFSTPATWKETADWLNHHADAVELARRASDKPALGFVYGAFGSANDPALFGPQTSDQIPGQPLMAVLLPHLNHLRMMANLLSFDAKLAASTGDKLRCQTDLQALMGLTRQLRHSDGFLLNSLVALGIDSLMIDGLQSTIAKYPGLFTDDQLITLAHEIAAPKVGQRSGSTSHRKVRIS